jgi:hypothetical protein
MQIIRSIEQNAIAVRSHAPAETFMELDEHAPTIGLTMDRPLFTPPFRLKFAQEAVADGDQTLAADALFEQVYVDKTRLMSHIRWALQTRQQISLADLVEHFPIEQGLAELVAYLSLATEDDAAVIDDREKQDLSWTDAAGTWRRATMPLVVFNARPAWNANFETKTV